MSDSAPLARVQISILNFNGEDYLRTSIESALAQTHRDIRVVVRDNRSTDSSHAIVASFDDPRLSLEVNAEPHGMSINWSNAALTAPTEFVAVLHHDDRIEPRFVEQLLADLDAHPDADAAICNIEYIDADGGPVSIARLERKRRTVRGPFTQAQYEQLLEGNYVYACSWLARRRLFDELTFEERFRWCPDWAFWLGVLATPGRAVAEPEILAQYRVHDASLSFSATNLQRRLPEEQTIAREALTRTPVRAAVRRRTETMIDVRAVAYAAQVLVAGKLALGAGLLRQLVRVRGVVAVPRGVFGLLLSEDVRIAAKQQIALLRSRRHESESASAA